MICKNLKEQNLQINEFNTKDVFIDKLADIVHEYNNTYHIQQLK